MSVKYVEAECVSNAPYISGEGLSTKGRLGNLTIGKIYRAQLDRDPEWVRVWDDLGEDYLYPTQMFRIGCGDK